ncbi:MAG: gluconolaconase [Nocardioides sp.]
MNRVLLTASAVALTLPLTIAGTSATASAAPFGHPATYELSGDPGGSKFEGIGTSPNGSTFYVTEVTGGELHRGDVSSGATTEWLPEGADGRFTARGVTTDREGRIYVAGGPNGLGTGRPDLWVYAADGSLLAAMRTGVANAFLNDVTIGPDGAAYFTNSNAPQIFRVAENDGGWSVSTWADATNSIPTAPGFNLGGIVVSPDRSSLVVAQGNVGVLWRFDLDTTAATRVSTGADVRNADGLVIQGTTLWVVRNADRVLTTLHLAPDASSATLRHTEATDPSRFFTTAKIAHGRLLLVDSKFDEPVAAPPYEVVSMALPR